MHLTQLIIRGAAWHAYESILYQIILCAHRILLYRTVGAVFFGSLGCMFSTAYAAIFLLQCGLHESIYAFFKDFSASRSAAYNFFMRYCIPHLGMLFLSFFLGVILFSYFVSDCTLFCALGLFFLCLCESIRCALRAFLQLIFINKQLAFIDLGGLILYLVLVWVPLLYGFNATSHAAFICPLAAVSFLQVIVLAWYTRNWYLTLPLLPANQIAYMRVVRLRFFASLHHLMSSPLITNMLVPFSAYTWGMEYAAAAKLLITIAQMITTIIRHTLGFSAVALCAHLKYLPWKRRNKMLFRLQQWHIILVCMLIASVTIFYNTYEFFISATATPLFISMFILGIFTLETFFIPWEAAYISQERTDILAFTFMASIFVCMSFSYFFSYSPSTLFCMSILIRYTLFGAYASLFHKNSDAL